MTTEHNYPCQQARIFRSITHIFHEYHCGNLRSNLYCYPWWRNYMGKIITGSLWGEGTFEWIIFNKQMVFIAEGFSILFDGNVELSCFVVDRLSMYKQSSCGCFLDLLWRHCNRCWKPGVPIKKGLMILRPHPLPKTYSIDYSNTMYVSLNTLRPRQSGRYFADDVFKCIFLNANVIICLRFHWRSFLSVQLTIFHLWFR